MLVSPGSSNTGFFLGVTVSEGSSKRDLVLAADFASVGSSNFTGFFAVTLFVVGLEACCFFTMIGYGFEWLRLELAAGSVFRAGAARYWVAPRL